MVDPLAGRHALPGTLNSRQLALILLSLVIAAAFYVVAASYLGSADLLQSLAGVDLRVVAFAMALTIVSLLLRFSRWSCYLHLFGYRIPSLRSFLIYLAGLALTTTPGKAGETVRSLFLRQLGVPYPVSLAAFVCDRLADLVAVLSVAALIGAFVYSESWYVGLVLVVVLVVTVTAVFAVRWLNGMEDARIRSTTIRRVWRHVRPLASNAGKCLSSWLFVLGIALGGLAYGLQAFAFTVVATSMGIGVPWPALIFTYFFATFTGAASMLPGGIGSMEIAMVVLLVHFGALPVQALSLTLITRLVTLWFAVALGGLCSLLLSSRRCF